MKNLIVRTITGLLFVAAIVVSFFDPIAMTALFALVTGLCMWEYSGLVNEMENVHVNRFISTVAGVYFFIATMAFCSGTVSSASVYIPYLLTVVYLFVSEIYANTKNAVYDLAHTMLGQMYIALPMSMINVLAFNITVEGDVVTIHCCHYRSSSSCGQTIPVPIALARCLGNTSCFREYLRQNHGRALLEEQ